MERCTTARQEDGRWVLGRAGPCRSLRELRRKLPEAGSTPGRGLGAVAETSHEENVSCSSNALGDLPFVFLDSLASFLLKNPVGDEERNFSPHGS